jgi:hypothetical protein
VPESIFAGPAWELYYSVNACFAASSITAATFAGSSSMTELFPLLAKEQHLVLSNDDVAQVSAIRILAIIVRGDVQDSVFRTLVQDSR